MRKTYFRLFPTALALLLILTGCEKGIDKKTVWDSITNNGSRVKPCVMICD